MHAHMHAHMHAQHTHTHTHTSFYFYLGMFCKVNYFTGVHSFSKINMVRMPRQFSCQKLPEWLLHNFQVQKLSG
jgi:hypothetical protein